MLHTKFHRTQFPQEVLKADIKDWYLSWSKHAKHATTDDRYGKAGIINRLPKEFWVVEIEQTNSRTDKWVIRYHFNENYDQTIVVRAINDITAVVVTTWLNHKDDNHASLKNSTYSDPALLNKTQSSRPKPVLKAK